MEALIYELNEEKISLKTHERKIQKIGSIKKERKVENKKKTENSCFNISIFEKQACLVTAIFICFAPLQ